MSRKISFVLLTGRLLAALLVISLLFADVEVSVPVKVIIALYLIVWLSGEGFFLSKAGLPWPTAHVQSLARLTRHSFKNHLQIVSGWLQMDRPDKAAAYLGSVKEHMAEEGKILRLSAPGLVVTLMDALHKAGASGVEVHVTVNASRHLNWPEKAIGFAWESMLPVAGEQGVHLHVDEASGILKIACPDARWPVEGSDGLEAQGRALSGKGWRFSLNRSQPGILVEKSGRWWW